MNGEERAVPAHGKHDFLNGIVHRFLHTNFSIILILVSLLVGLAALLVTPREEDPQIVVPLADVYVNAPGLSAGQVEQLVATPLEKYLYQIDGVEYVYSMSRESQALITVRFYVGQDRERSLVRLFKKLDENRDVVPPGVTGWVVKPVEIDDVPVVTLTLTDEEGDGDSHGLRRVGEELVQRFSALPNVSRAEVIGGEPRTVRVDLDPERLQGYNLSPLEVQKALAGANVVRPAGEFTRGDAVYRVEAGLVVDRPEQLPQVVVGVSEGRPVFLKDVATVRDGPAEAASYVRHGWGPSRHAEGEHGSVGTVVGEDAEVDAGRFWDGTSGAGPAPSRSEARPAVTIAISKQKGTNAVAVSDAVLKTAESLRREVVPSDVAIVVTRNSGLIADDKVNELIEALWVAILIVVALLTLSLGWREAIIVAVAVPVVFGLTLGVNLLFGYTINRVTLFALILSLGLLVDDPIVDVENIARHFSMRGKATRDIVLEAVAEIRPPLISATLAVIVSFLPMFFITGMMGPYMAPMALNVPVAMLMSMVVAFTITPWLAYRVLRRKFEGDGGGLHGHEPDDPDAIKETRLYKVFYPLMRPLLRSRFTAALFLLFILLLTAAAMGLAAYRSVPLKMLPFDNKNELLLTLDMDEGTTLERTDAVVREMESVVGQVPEVMDFTCYVGVAGPIDFNGLVRHYYLRRMPHQAEVRLSLVGKKHRQAQSHAVALRLHEPLARVAERHHAVVKVVELPPGPPVLSSIVAEVYGRPDHSYGDQAAAAGVVADRLRREPGVIEVDDMVEAAATRLVFEADQEKAALGGVSVEEIARTLQVALGGEVVGTVRLAGERNPLGIELRLPRPIRSSPHDLGRIRVKGRSGRLVPLAEIGAWRTTRVDQTTYHKNLERVMYVYAETAGRTPAECVLDVSFDRVRNARDRAGSVSAASPRPLDDRTFFSIGGGIPWSVPEGIRVEFAGEGEWKITLDVFRDLGLAFAAAMVMIYVILVAQTNSFLIPVVVMLAIPLTVLGVMPGFWLLNRVAGQTVGGFADPVFFTATAMIGMIALAGIVTRDSIILVDFIQQSVAKGRSLFDAIMESRVIRLRPILLTAGAAMLSSIPITLDPIFSGLAWSLIFGLIASTVFTLFVIPVTYWLLYSGSDPASQAGAEAVP
ncbi:Toluene efflux pump membrane transporter TtgB [Aquisphaera giovannonii]|uniref:Toluene efflux pump membrane transporter TtgB n=1 Tax=Aquisphaera giovannonii TaxID=406548 RepID=A0A5B9VY14_9BACT|nr:efflux RND transporter permease subunit [Aquisphaera giovannonii]QEH33198.1 Toluene efflux pump membrane transporter TtgB [Aquisphaera giovannonii]